MIWSKLDSLIDFWHCWFSNRYEDRNENFWKNSWLIFVVQTGVLHTSRYNMQLPHKHSLGCRLSAWLGVIEGCVCSLQKVIPLLCWLKEALLSGAEMKTGYANRHHQWLFGPKKPSAERLFPLSGTTWVKWMSIPTLHMLVLSIGDNIELE